MRNRKLFISIGVIGVSALLASCQTAGEEHGDSNMSNAGPVFLRRIDNPGEIYLTASASGILSLKGECLMLGSTTIVWPANARLSRDNQGRISILNTTSGKSVRLGERIAMGGGEVDRLAPGILEEGGARLGQCPAPYFLADNAFRPE
jgi:hypothetical protein